MFWWNRAAKIPDQNEVVPLPPIEEQIAPCLPPYCLLSDIDLSKFEVSDVVRQKAQSEMLVLLSKLCRDSEWNQISNYLDRVEKSLGFEDQKVKSWVTATSARGNLNLMHLVCLYGGPALLAEKLFLMGITPDARATVLHEGKRITDCTYLHLALGNHRTHLLPVLLKWQNNGSSTLGSLNSEGDTPALTYARHAYNKKNYDSSAPKIFKKLAYYGDKFDHRNNQGKTVLTYLVEGEYWNAAEVVVAHESKVVSEVSPTIHSKEEIQLYAVEAVSTERDLSGLLGDLVKLERYAQKGNVIKGDVLVAKLASLMAEALPKVGDKDGCQEFERFIREVKAGEEIFSTEVIKQAINYPVNLEDTRVLHVLCRHKASPELVSDVLAMGADVNPIEKTAGLEAFIGINSGYTPLNLALEARQFKLAELLIKAGGDTTILDPFGESYLNINHFLKHFNLDTCLEDLKECPLLTKLLLPEHDGLLEWLVMLPNGASNAISQINRGYQIPKHIAELNFSRFAPDAEYPITLQEILQLMSANKIVAPLNENTAGIIVGELLNQIKLDQAISLLERGAPAPEWAHKNGVVRDKQIPDFKGHGEFVILLKELASEFSNNDHRSVSILVRALRNSSDLRQVIFATKFNKEISRSSRQGQPVERLIATTLPNLLFQMPPGVLSDYAYVVEHEFIGRAASYRNTIELMALLGHPGIESENDPSIAPLTLAISALGHFLFKGKVVTGQAIKIWREIADIGLGFKRYRNTTQRSYGVDDTGKKVMLAPSLYELAGATRLLTRPDNKFSEGYILLGRELAEKYGDGPTNSLMEWAIDPQTCRISRRGCEVIANHSLGVLVVRNSSLKFGRDLLIHPAYYARPNPNKFTLAYLKNLTPEIVERDFIPILNHDLYEKRLFNRRKSHADEPNNSALNEISLLLEQDKARRAAFRAFLFDTDRESAWDEDANGRVILKGACNSLGFKALTQKLRYEYNEEQSSALMQGREAMPTSVLEIHNPNFLPFAPYARLIVDGEVLKLLEHLAEHGWQPNEISDDVDKEEEEEDQLDKETEDESENMFVETGVFPFIQRALTEQAELIVLPYEGDRE